MAQPDNLKIARWESVKLNKGKSEIVVKASANGKELQDSAVWTFDPAAPDPETAACR